MQCSSKHNIINTGLIASNITPTDCQKYGYILGNQKKEGEGDKGKMRSSNIKNGVKMMVEGRLEPASYIALTGGLLQHSNELLHSFKASKFLKR
jgi:hypothetical protein